MPNRRPDEDDEEPEPMPNRRPDPLSLSRGRDHDGREEGAEGAEFTPREA